MDDIKNIDDIKKQKRREYNKKYRSSDKGKATTRRSIEKYQKTDNSKAYFKKYYQRKKEEKIANQTP